VAEVFEPEKIPPEIRYFGTEFPDIGKPTLIAKDDITVAPKETGNKRCA
jgi:hypothetical protein